MSAAGLQTTMPSHGWARYPNLQRGANFSRNKGRGRLQIQVRRAFIDHPLRSTSDIYDWCYARDRSRTRSEAMRWSVRRILDATCDRAGRADTPADVAVAPQTARGGA
jgi:hypothetical protein